MRKAFFVAVFILAHQAHGQQRCMTVDEAAKQGLSIDALNRRYKSAVHVDSSQAVFRTDSARAALAKAYQDMLQELGGFLRKHQFRWQQPVRCWNRIYFTKEGRVDYFLFQFRSNDKGLPSPEQQTEFQRLVQLFIADYRFGLQADEPFAQCSPVTYRPD